MRRRRAIGFAALTAACALAAGAGCTHHHHYYTTPGAVGVTVSDPCAPAGTVISAARPAMTTPALGAVCDEPPQGSAATRGTPMLSNAGTPATPAPIYSRPIGRPLRRGGLAWRGSNTESLATTRIEGAYDDESTYK